MISKERFVKTLDFIKKMHEIENEVNGIFERNNMDYNAVLFCEYEGELFDLLVDCMNDTNYLTCWWVYDTNFGQELGEECPMAEDDSGNKIDLKTPEQLYEYLANGIDKDHTV